MFTAIRTAAAAALVLAGGAVAHQSTQAGPQKFAFVDTEKLMAGAPGREAAKAVFEKEAAAFAAKAQKWQDSLKTLSDNFQKEEPKLTDAQKKARVTAFQTIQAEFQTKGNEGQQALDARENELLAPMMEMVKKSIDDIRTEDGYAMIFSGGGNSPIVSADKNLDITDRVMARLKTMTPKAPAAPSAMGPSAVTKRPPPR